jgi:putative Ca2+/H+ antiporter (TMEM165/GDT1 family)
MRTVSYALFMMISTWLVYLLLAFIRDRVPSRFLEITYGIIIVLFGIMAVFSNTYLWRLQ